MRLSSFAGTDVGRTRSGNEDSYFCGRTVFAVADGLGGHQGGEVASAAAVAPLAALDGRELDPAEAAEALTAAIREANAAIIDQAAGDPGLWGMGTTVTAAALAGDRHLQLAHVGDSRAYLLRDGSLEQLTTDHTVVGELIPPRPPHPRPGRRPPRAQHPHPRRRPRPPSPSTPRPPGARPRRPGPPLLRRPHRGGRRPHIAELLTTGPDGDAACRLIDAANDAGGPDNITVVLIRVE